MVKLVIKCDDSVALRQPYLYSSPPQQDPAAYENAKCEIMKCNTNRKTMQTLPCILARILL